MYTPRNSNTGRMPSMHDRQESLHTQDSCGGVTPRQPPVESLLPLSSWWNRWPPQLPATNDGPKSGGVVATVSPAARGLGNKVAGSEEEGPQDGEEKRG